MQDSEAVSKALQELETANNTKRIEDIEYVISELQKVNSTMDDFTKNAEWQKTKEFLADFDARYHTQALTNCNNLAAFASTIRDNLNKGKFVDAMKEAFGNTLGVQVHKIWQEQRDNTRVDVGIYADAYILARDTVAVLSPSSFKYDAAKDNYNAMLRTYQYWLQEKNKYEELTPDEEEILKLSPLSDAESYYIVDGKLMKISGTQNNLLDASGNRLKKVVVYKYDAATDSYAKGQPLKDVVENAGTKWSDYVSQFRQTGDEAMFLATTPGLSQYDIIQNTQNRDGHYSIIMGNTLIGTEILGDPNEKFWESKELSFDTKPKRPIYISKLDQDAYKTYLDRLHNINYKVQRDDSGELVYIKPNKSDEGQWYFDGGINNVYAIDTSGSIWNDDLPILRDYVIKAIHGDKVDFKYTGDLDYSGGRVVINERGPEALVSPHGDMSFMPYARGSYSISEIAPYMQKVFNEHSIIHSNNLNIFKNSINVKKVYATINADDGFDIDSYQASVERAKVNGSL